MDSDVIGDMDNVVGLEYGSYFDFAAEVVEEAAVTVIIGDYGLATAESVIGDDIDDDDCDDFDVLDFVGFFGERIYLFSFI